MDRHTPGPWSVIGDAGHPANARITSAQRRHVAKVYAESPSRDLVCEANARLIAAAPELLDLLRRVRAYESDREEDPAVLWDAVDAALTKATGTEP